jgi:acetyltransferase-like isoleucine patch superfamily enzyme
VTLWRRVRAVPRRWRALIALADLPGDARRGLVDLAQVQAKENVTPRRRPTIDPTSIISPLASIRFDERVEIGARATIGPWCCVWGGWSRTWARVGADALLSPGVILVAGNHGMDGTGPIRDQPFIELDVEIGEGAWIGAHAVVVGCRVGRGAVVGAGAVVTSDIPYYAIAVGIPARVVGSRDNVEQPSGRAQ